MEFKFHIPDPSRPSLLNRPIVGIRTITIWSNAQVHGRAAIEVALVEGVDIVVYLQERERGLDPWRYSMDALPSH